MAPGYQQVFTSKRRKSTYRLTWFGFMGVGDPVKIEDGGREGWRDGGDTVTTRVCPLTWTYLIGTRENNITALLATKSRV